MSVREREESGWCVLERERRVSGVCFREREVRVMCMMCVYERVGERKTDLNTKPAPNLSPNTNTITNIM